MAWAKNGTPSTLTGAADVITISDLTAKKFNKFLMHHFVSGADALRRITFNNNSNSVYARRYSANGGADATGTSLTYIELTLADGDQFTINYNCSISGQEKLGLSFLVNSVSAGAGTAPQRLELVSKFVPSPDADITRIDSTNPTGGVDYAIGSNLSALGEGTPVVVNIQNGTVFEETDTNKSFIFNSSTGAWTQF